MLEKGAVGRTHEETDDVEFWDISSLFMLAYLIHSYLHFNNNLLFSLSNARLKCILVSK